MHCLSWCVSSLAVQGVVDVYTWKAVLVTSHTLSIPSPLRLSELCPAVDLQSDVLREASGICMGVRGEGWAGVCVLPSAAEKDPVNVSVVVERGCTALALNAKHR